MSSEPRRGTIVEATAVISAVLPAPPELAFEVWTEPRHLLRWWGRFIGYTPESISSDTRPGGSFEILMRQADGRKYRIFGSYDRVEAAKALSYNWSFQRIGADGAADAPSVDASQVEVSFAAHPGGCEVILTHRRLPSAKECASVAEGWSGVFALATEYIIERIDLPDYSEEELSKLPNSSIRKLRLETDIQARPEEIWRWLTHADLLMRWFPQSAETEPCHGGSYRFVWNMGDGEHMKMGHYNFCAPSHVLVYDWYPWGWTLAGEAKGPDPKESETRVEWTISAQGEGSHLALEHSGWRAGIDWDKQLKGHAEGWDMYLRNLKSVMEGGEDIRKK